MKVVCGIDWLRLIEVEVEAGVQCTHSFVSSLAASYQEEDEQEGGRPHRGERAKPKAPASRWTSLLARGVQPGLLNHQSTAAFRLEDEIGSTSFCTSFRVCVSGQRMDMLLKGDRVPLTKQRKGNNHNQQEDDPVVIGSQNSIDGRPSTLFGRFNRPSVSSATKAPGPLGARGSGGSLPGIHSRDPSTTGSITGGSMTGPTPSRLASLRRILSGNDKPRREAEPSSAIPAGGTKTGGRGSNQSSVSVSPFLENGDELFMNSASETSNYGHNAVVGCTGGAGQKLSDAFHIGDDCVFVQRLYCFSVEVWPPPGDGVFTASKVLTIKNKYLILNDTGIPMEYKQRDTPDPDKTFGKGMRFAGTLPCNTRIAHHWDDVTLDKALVIRPAGADWQWSGSFEMVAEEKYFGLKIRRNNPADGSIIIPISVTVGGAGSVLVTLKSEGSVPPYMVLNRCKDIVVHLRQSDLHVRDGWDLIGPLHKAVPFAWDEPDGNEMVEVLAAFQTGMRDREANCSMMEGATVWREHLDVDTEGSVEIPLGEVVGGSKPGSVHVLHVAQSKALKQLQEQEVQDMWRAEPSDKQTVLGRLSPLDATSNVRSMWGAGVSEEPPMTKESTLSRKKTQSYAAKKMFSVSKFVGASARVPHQTRPSRTMDSMLGQQDSPSQSGSDRTSSPVGVSGKDSFATLASTSEHLPTLTESPRSHVSDHKVERSQGSAQQKILRNFSAIGRGVAASASTLMPSAGRRGTASTSTGDFERDSGRGRRGVDMAGSKSKELNDSNVSGSILKSSDYAKKIYVTVYADGPTRVLCFSEDPTFISTVINTSDINSLPNLAYRLQKIGSRLSEVDHLLGIQLGTTEHPSHLNYHQHSVHQAISQSASGRPTGPSMSPHDSYTGRSGASFSGGHSTGGRPPGLAGSTLDKRPLLSLANVPMASDSLPKSRQASFQGGASSVVSMGDDRWPKREGAVANTSLLDSSIGGDVKVLVKGGRGLMSGDKTFNSYAKIMIVNDKLKPKQDARTVESEPTPASTKKPKAPLTNPPLHKGKKKGGAKEVKGKSKEYKMASTISGSGTGTSVVMTRTVWNSSAPLWHCEHTFRDTSAQGMLRLEVYCIPSYYGHNDRYQKNTQTYLIQNGSVAYARFLGVVEVPLRDTLGKNAKEEAKKEEEQEGEGKWYPLLRYDGTQSTKGEVQLSFEWQFTQEGLLLREIRQLEKMLDDRIEMLSVMNPVSSITSEQWLTSYASYGQQAPPAKAKAKDSGGKVTRDIDRLGNMGETFIVCMDVSVLKVRNLAPRTGVISDISKTLKNSAQFEFAPSRLLPRAVVVVDVGGERQTVTAPTSCLNPQFPQTKPLRFRDVRLGSLLGLQVYDRLHKLSAPYARRLVGTAELYTSSIRSHSHTIDKSGDSNINTADWWDPVYMWVPLHRTGSEASAMEAHTGFQSRADCNLEVFLRVQIIKPEMEGVQLDFTLDMAGIGLCAKSNVYELFNFTLHQIRACMLQTQADLQLAAVIESLQLDNQALNTMRPVVISPADKQSAQAKSQLLGDKLLPIENANQRTLRRILNTTDKQPLIYFDLVRTMSSVGRSLAEVTGPASSSQVRRPRDKAASSNSTPSGAVEVNAITSFKRLVFHIGPLDFSTDQDFMETLLHYFQNLPTSYLTREGRAMDDIEAAYARGQINSCSSLALSRNSSLPLDDPKPEVALHWLYLKEEQDLSAMRDQSSSWFFLEEFYLSSLQVNITLNLTSNFNMLGRGRDSGGAGQGGGATDKSPATHTGDKEIKSHEQGGLLSGALTRISGGQGFQLINVTNAPISLASISLPNKLFNKVGFINNLQRHYSWIAMTETRKVLGGAGPVVTVLPATFLWFGISLAEMGKDVADGRLSPLKIPSRVGFYMFTSMGQVLGMFSRVIASVMLVLPVQRQGRLSDQEAIERFVLRPQTVVDSLYQAQNDIMMGLGGGLEGFLLDPYEGARRLQGAWAVAGFFLGLFKGSLGVVLRPAAGVIDSGSKLLQGLGLVCLGKRGIQGKLVRRITVPSAPLQNAGLQGDNRKLEQKRAQLIEAWQSSLPHMDADFANDKVIDVIAARRTRVVLLTNNHVAYLYAKYHSSAGSAIPDSMFASSSNLLSVTYKVKWVIPNQSIDNIRSVERTYRISIEYRKSVEFMGLSLNLPVRKGLRCNDEESHRSLIYRLNRHMGKDYSGEMAMRGMRNEASGIGRDVLDLAIGLPRHSAAPKPPAPRQ